MKVNGELGKPFETRIGTPQGDVLSPILFVIYLENAMREIRSTDIALYGKCNGNNWNIYILEFQYSDDCDFIICILKTEIKSIEDGATKLIDYKKLDSHLYSVADVKLRVKKKSNLAFHIM